MAYPKLTREDALKIRQLYAENKLTGVQLAKRYNVAANLISRIIMGKYTGVTDLPNISRHQR